jgi:regulatory protein
MPKPPKPITEKYLRWHVDNYLKRYFTSTSHLKRLLLKRVRRSAEYWGSNGQRAREQASGTVPQQSRFSGGYGKGGFGKSSFGRKQSWKKSSNEPVSSPKPWLRASAVAEVEPEEVEAPVSSPKPWLQRASLYEARAVAAEPAEPWPAEPLPTERASTEPDSAEPDPLEVLEEEAPDDTPASSNITSKTTAELLEEGTRMVEKILAESEQQGQLDDDRFAASKVRSLSRRGISARGIAARLAAKGLKGEQVEAGMNELKAEMGGDPEQAAAAALIRKKKLGPYRPASTRRDNWQRDLGVLARAGFSFDLAKKLLATESIEELEDLVAGR